MQGVQLFLALHGLFSDGHVANDGGHAGHRHAQVVTGTLDFLALSLQLVDDGALALPDLLELLHTVAPEGHDDDGHEDVGGQHPP